jgi:glycosyltransferase involved in cell wall biosynthesis
MVMEQCWHTVPGGTAVAALEMASALSARGVDVTGIAARHSHPPDPMWQPTVPVRHMALPMQLLYSSWQRAGWPKVSGVDVVHATSPIMPATDLPLVATVHDLAFLEAGRHTRWGRRLFLDGLELLRTKAAHVMCSSERTLELVRQQGVDVARSSCVPLGVRIEPVSVEVAERVRRRHRLPEQFVLFVGTREPRKNLFGLMNAMDELEWELPLVIAGPTGWGPFELADAPPDRLVITGLLERDELMAMYSMASVVAYPSYEEGFGFPVLEAMACGTPVVTSFGTSTQEVAGGAAILIDPQSPRDIAKGIRQAIDQRDVLVAAGHQRVAECSWDKTAELIEAVYRSAMK